PDRRARRREQRPDHERVKEHGVIERPDPQRAPAVEGPYANAAEATDLLEDQVRDQEATQHEEERYATLARLEQQEPRVRYGLEPWPERCEGVGGEHGEEPEEPEAVEVLEVRPLLGPLGPRAGRRG